MLGDAKDPTAEGLATELFWELWSETADWCTVEKAAEDWIREGRRCAEWLQMILVMEQDAEDRESAKRLMGEASELLGRTYGCLGQLSTRLSAVRTGTGKRFPQMFWPYSHCA